MEYIHKRTDLEQSILVVPGRLDAISYLALEEILLSLFADKGRGLAIDFDRVDYISSAGLRALMRGFKQMQSNGGAMSLFNLRPEVLKVFQLSGFDRVFHITQTEAEALESVRRDLL